MKITTLLTLIILTLFLNQALGFSSHNTEILRTFDRTKSVPGSSVAVKVIFTNNETSGLKGFYYAEHVPSGVSLNSKSVKINGNVITDYILETGQKGDVYSNYITCRWILEQPPLFEENNPITTSGTIEIIYTISSSNPGVYVFDEFSWAGYYPNLPEDHQSAFGFSEENDKKTIIFENSGDIEAIDDNYTVIEGGTLIRGSSGGVLANDTYSGDNLITVLLERNVTCGTLTLNRDGSFAYNHDGSETHFDNFSYSATDGADNSGIAIVNILITPVNDAPIARDDSMNTQIATRVTINVLQNDMDDDGTIDPATINIVKNPLSGTAEANSDGTISYNPGSGFEGSDTFVYNVKDDQGVFSNDAVVTISVSKGPDSGGSGGGCFMTISNKT